MYMYIAFNTKNRKKERLKINLLITKLKILEKNQQNKSKEGIKIR